MSTDAPLPRADAERRPNVVLICMDDLDYGDLACHGNPHVRTPNLDALHGESVRCTRSCSGSLCTPARSSLMTGRYPYRTRAFDTYCGRSTIDPDEITAARVLRDAGYATCLSGKWHLGDNYPSRPIDMGFDTQLMHKGGGLRQPANPGYWQERDGYFDPLLDHDGAEETFAGYCTDVFTDHALSFVERHRDEPFFVYLATNAPHGPFLVGEEWAQRYRDQGLHDELARLYGMVENVDHNVGRLRAKLEELGLAEDTILIYTSDHGGDASHFESGERFGAGLRAGKGTPYEGGVRVPYFWTWPRRFGRRGWDMDRIMGPMDVLPTLAEACEGARLPADRTIDGVSLLPLLTGATAPAAWPDRYVFLQWHRGNEPIPYRGCIAQRQDYKLVNGRELYCLAEDPGERRDRAAEHPEVVAELRAAYERWLADVSRTRPDNFAPPAVPVGTPHERPTALTRNDWRVHARDEWIDDTADGHWEVRFAKAGSTRYDVELELPPAGDDAAVTLIFGESARSARLEPGTRTHRFEGVEAAPGLGRIEAWIADADGKRSARYVRVS